MNLDFSLPTNIDNWEIKYFAKFTTDKENGDTSFTIACGELILFIANNVKQLSEHGLMLFLDKVEKKFGVSKNNILQGVRNYQTRADEIIKPSADSEDEQEQIRENGFVKSIQKIRELYPTIAVNALTKELVTYDKKGKIHTLLHQTLFTDLKLNGVRVSKSDILDYLYSPKYTNHINPIKNIIDDFPRWETGDYDFVNGMFEMVKLKYDTAETFEFYKSAFTKWAVKCIDNALNDSALPNKQIIIFQGGQSSRKTSLIRSLMRPFYPYTKEQIEVKNHEIQTKKAITQNMFILNDEFDKLTVNELKEFKIIMAADDVKYKPQGSSFEQNFKRRANFISSTNPERFLTDDTGNVRFVILPLLHTFQNPIPAVFLDDTEFFKGFWGQIFNLWRESQNGTFNAELSVDEMVIQERLNRNHFTYKSLESAIMMLYPPANSGDAKTMKSATELLTELLHNQAIPSNFRRGLNEITIGRHLNRLGYNRAATHTDGTQKYRYEFRNLSKP